jgi:uncharacterized protein YdhG (YjbR/CyaY superfamily)
MKIEARDAAGYVAAIPAERRPHVERLRALVKEAVPEATEGIVWGMLGYSIAGRPFVAIASQKNYLSLYLCDLYTQPALRKKHEKALAGLKMGKSCINFQSVDELPLETIKAIVAEAPNVAVESGTMAKKKKMVKPASKKTPTRPRARA